MAGGLILMRVERKNYADLNLQQVQNDLMLVFSCRDTFEVTHQIINHGTVSCPQELNVYDKMISLV